MSEADKMFEELGYKLEYEDDISFTLANREKARYITFIRDSKTLMLPANITMKELQVINKKVEELRMEIKQANTNTTYCINTTCKKRCWRHISNWKFDADKNYWYTSGIENCQEIEDE